MAGSASLKNMFANVFIKIQTTRHANNSTGFGELVGGGGRHLEILHHPLVQGLANWSYNGPDKQYFQLCGPDGLSATLPL